MFIVVNNNNNNKNTIFNIVTVHTEFLHLKKNCVSVCYAYFAVRNYFLSVLSKKFRVCARVCHIEVNRKKKQQ